MGGIVMNKYIYTDHRIEKVIFTTKADNILKADKLFKNALGYDVSKHNYIGCEIIFSITTKEVRKNG